MKTVSVEFGFHQQEGRRSPKLKRDQETELLTRWREQGDHKAGNELVRAHAHQVLSVALRYRRYGLPVAELIAEGNFGLAHAVRKFDSARGVRLVTYANHWIRAYILDYVTKSRSVVSGASCPGRSFGIRRERARAVNILGEGEAADTLAAERLGMTPDRLRRVLHRLDTRDQPLDATQSENESRTPFDTLSAQDDPERSLSDHQLEMRIQHAVRQALSALDSRERFIVERRLMADRGKALALVDIGRCLGVSPERARQLEARAKRKLRSRISAMEDTAVSDLLGS